MSQTATSGCDSDPATSIHIALSKQDPFWVTITERTPLRSRHKFMNIIVHISFTVHADGDEKEQRFFFRLSSSSMI